MFKETLQGVLTWQFVFLLSENGNELICEIQFKTAIYAQKTAIYAQTQWCLT